MESLGAPFLLKEFKLARQRTKATRAAVQAKRVECRTLLFDRKQRVVSSWTSLLINAFTIAFMRVAGKIAVAE